MLRRVFITGANSGIGFELAKQYISRGDDVALFDLHFNEQTKQSLSDLADDYQYIEYFATPICDNEALQTQVNNAIAAIGKPDLAIFSCSTNEQLSKENSIDSIACQHFATLITPHLSMNGHLAITSPLIELMVIFWLNWASVPLKEKLKILTNPDMLTSICPNDKPVSSVALTVMLIMSLTVMFDNVLFKVAFTIGGSTSATATSYVTLNQNASIV